VKDYATGTTVYLKFGTVRPSTGASYALAGGAVSVYKDNSTTQTTTGVTLTADFDSVTGLNHVTVDTSADGTFYSAGSEFQLVLTAGTVDSISVVGQVVGEFSLGKTSALRPTVAGRTLDVSAGGEAGVDWANVGSPTTTVDLTGTTISTSQAVASVSGSVGSVTAAITLPTIPADWITSSGLAGSAVTEIQSGLLTTGTFNSAIAELPDQVADAVWDDAIADHLSVGSTGESLYRTLAIKTKTDNLPSDPADQSLIETAITNATSGLATAVDLATVDTVVDAIKLKTDNLPSDPADQSAVEAAITAATSGLATASSIVTLTTKVDTLDDYVDTEVAAIKAKTDNLPADPADASDIAASFVTVNSKLDAIDDYVDSEVSAIKVVTDRLSGMLVQDGLVYQYTTNALENAPSGGGGGTTVAVYPLNATMPARVYDLNLTFYKNEDGTVVGPIAVTSRNADVFEPVDLSGRTLSVRFVDYEGTELLTVADADITVSGADDNQISFPVTTDLTGSVTELPQDQWHIWTLRDLTNGDNVLISGRARVLLS